jgi:hypothetical protein
MHQALGKVSVVLPALNDNENVARLKPRLLSLPNFGVN